MKADAPAIYDDGVSVRLGKVTTGSTLGAGAGAIEGQPYILADVTVHNEGKEPLDLRTAVVSARYTPGSGAGELAAQGTYLPTSHDLGGVVEPGKSTTATYAFLVPKGAGWRMVVDLDGTRTPAVFRSR